MGSKGPPAPPTTGPGSLEYAAEKQFGMDQQLLSQQTAANRPNQYNPWGSRTWQPSQVIDPTTGQAVTTWADKVTLDPRLQTSLDAQMGLSADRSQLASGMFGQLQQQMRQPVDFSGFTPYGFGGQVGQLGAITNPNGFGSPGVPQLNTNLGQDAGQGMAMGLNFGGMQDVAGSGQQRQRAEDAIYQSATSRLDPQWQQRTNDLETQLANKGISSNSTAYTNAMSDFNRSRTDAYQQAQMGAITGAGAEAQRNYSMDMGVRQQQADEAARAAGFQNAAQQQAYSQRFGAGEANNAAMGQQFGYGMDYTAQQLYGQQQAFNQQRDAGSQNFDQQMQQSQYQDQQRTQQIQEYLTQRGYPLQEINALLAGGDIGMPDFGSFAQAGQGEGPDYMGIQKDDNQSQLDVSNAKAAKRGQTTAAIGTVAMAAAVAF